MQLAQEIAPPTIPPVAERVEPRFSTDLYWTRTLAQVGPPWVIRLVKAETYEQADELLRPEKPRMLATLVKVPSLRATAADRPDGVVWEQLVERLPGSYDPDYTATWRRGRSA